MARKTRARRSGCRGAILTIISFGALLVVAGGVFLWHALNLPYQGYDEAAVRVEIERGASVPQILRRLQSAGVIRDEFIPMIYLRTLKRGESLKAGIYEFDAPMSPIAALDKLIRGDVILQTITIREGLDRFEIARLMAGAGFGTEAEWTELTSQPDAVHDIAPEADSLEGFLFPDTYMLTPGTPARSVVAMMVQNFRRQFGEDLAFITTGFSLYETVTLASIVETEARLPDERPVVASVYLNRTRINMPLQADPTVIYAMKLAGRWEGRITREDLRIDSPYNTYRYRGFPPGPIANPGLASLRAASSPATTDYLYFVSRNDGSHVFATNLKDHNRNVEIWQRQYWREKRAAQQRQNAAEKQD